MTLSRGVVTDGALVTVTFSLSVARSATAVNPFLLIKLGTTTRAGPGGNVVVGVVWGELDPVSNVRHNAAPLTTTASKATTNAPTKIFLI